MCSCCLFEKRKTFNHFMNTKFVAFFFFKFYFIRFLYDILMCPLGCVWNENSKFNEMEQAGTTSKILQICSPFRYEMGRENISLLKTYFVECWINKMFLVCDFIKTCRKDKVDVQKINRWNCKLSCVAYYTVAWLFS